MFISELYAMGSTGNGGAASGQSSLISFMPMVLIFFIFYFLLIRPQQKKAKEQQNMINNLKKNDKVIMNSGIIGTVLNIKGNIIELKVDDNTKIQILKSSISQIFNQDDTTKVNVELIK